MSNESNNTSAAATTPPTTAPSSSDPDASEAGLAPEVGDCAGAAVTVAEGVAVIGNWVVAAGAASTCSELTSPNVELACHANVKSVGPARPT